MRPTDLVPDPFGELGLERRARRRWICNAADGLWPGGRALDIFQQGGMIRERVLTVYTGVAPPLGVFDFPASGHAKESPMAPPAGVGPPDMGPHFVMSPETTDGRPALGFQFALLNSHIFAGVRATPGAGGFSVTPWILVANAMTVQSPEWVAMATIAGVGVNQLFSSFDINASAVRFQIGNVAVDGAVQIMFAEL